MAPLAGKGRECLPLKTLQEVMPQKQASNLASKPLSMMMSTGTGMGPSRAPLPIQIIQPSKVKDTLLEHNAGFRSMESKLSFEPKVFKFLF